MGRWVRLNCGAAAKRFNNRERIFDFIGRQVGERRVLYLEFGVYQGDSIRYWQRLLKNPQAILHGFDSFEGLPERWTVDRPKGYFSTSGQVPEVSDNRVKFFKGWFEETLPNYVPPAHEVLVVNMDADLYSSTKFVLSHLKNVISVGSWLYFDEFSNWLHEFRAFREFVEETAMKFETVAASADLWHVAFRRVA
jgi:hypothetical protein